MPQAPYQIIAGPANVFIAPYGTAFPDVGLGGFLATAITNWTFLGKTDGGVKVAHSEKILQIMADQTTGPVKAQRTDEGLSITFALLEMTLEHYAIVMNNAAVTTVAQGGGGSGITGNKVFAIHQGFDVAQWALVVRGPSPYFNGNLQYEVPLVIENGQPKTDFQRTKVSTLDAEFVALEDPAASQSGANVPGAFGNVRAQTTATP